ncbi:MAG TPA: hypothetical protein VG937_21590 [Polyangiaceae bacterium]|nr:hypothetical protein [Polyangiaceae bacterium]
MQLWLVLLGCGVVLGVIVLFAALRVELEARGFGEPSGAWATAFGVASGPGTLSGVCGRGLPLALEVHAFGRRFPLKWRWRRAPPASPLPEQAAPTESLTARIQRFLDSPLELDMVLRALRLFELDRLSVDAAYGFRDIVLTGRVAGMLYALSGALPDKVRLTQRPSWDGSERWELSANGRVSFYPALVLLTVLWYMLRIRTRRSPPGHSPGRALESTP